LAASPVDRIDAIEVPRTLPRPAAAADMAAVLDAICSRRPRNDVPLGVIRDRVLFEIMTAGTGLESAVRPPDWDRAAELAAEVSALADLRLHLR